MPKNEVACSFCAAQLSRYPINPNTNVPILNFFCNTKCKGDWQRAQKESLGFTKEWLEREYVTLGKSANQIAREIGRDSKGVWKWIKDYGIPTRSRGHDTSHLPKDGSTFRGKSHSEETKARLSEIAIAEGRVPYDPKVGSYMNGRRGSMCPNWKGGATPLRQAFYASEEWVSVLKLVWARDDATCQRCKKHNIAEGMRGTFHVHHVVSFSVESLRAELSNLVLLCRPCHLWVHSKKNTNKEFIKELGE